MTNWIAIKLLFDPAEPVQVGPIMVQGLFESRQVEVSDEVSEHCLYFSSIFSTLWKLTRPNLIY